MAPRRAVREVVESELSLGEESDREDDASVRNDNGSAYVPNARHSSSEDESDETDSRSPSPVAAPVAMGNVPVSTPPSSAPAADQHAPIPSYDRSMAGQTQLTFDRAVGSMAVSAASLPVAPAVTQSVAAQPMPPAVMQPVDVEPPAKRGPGRPRTAGKAKSKGLKRVRSAASLADDESAQHRKGTVKWAAARMDETSAEMRAATADLVRRINDATTNAQSERMEIRTLTARLDKLQAEVRSLREERNNIFDSGSESGESPVRKTGNKRKSRSPRGPAKRVRPSQPSSDGSSSDSDEPAPIKRKMNPIPLEQRISEPEHRTRLPPSLPPPFQATASSSTVPRPPHTTPATHRNSKDDVPAPPQRTQPAHPVASSSQVQAGRRDRDASSSRPTRDDRHRDGNVQQSSYAGGSQRGRDASRGRGRGGGSKGKGRDNSHGRHLPPPFEREPDVVWVEMGPVSWGTRSRDVFLAFCDHIDADNFGPAPRPVYVSDPDKDGYANAKFVGANYRNARENAEQMIHVWTAWSRGTQQYLHVNVSLLQ
jgi:hypothetical protein